MCDTRGNFGAIQVIMVTDFGELLKKSENEIFLEILKMTLDELRSLIHYITHSDFTQNHSFVANIILDNHGEHDVIIHDFMLFTNTVHMMLFLISRGFFITFSQIIDKVNVQQQREMTTTWCGLSTKSSNSFESIPPELLVFLPRVVPSLDDRDTEYRIANIFNSCFSLQKDILEQVLLLFPLGSVDNYGFTLLHIIVYHGTVELVDLYLTQYPVAHGELNAQTFIGKTPLMIAISRGNMDIVRRLILEQKK